ncbi:hypothetical protein [Hyphomicrobium sp.]|uniref:hypothetical protein n=1 Tax=Hyphomicrobium sp. TaxID=82 RepID=UPI002E37B12B|nr:hypothetical protein [Hyphomicrobium sp.]HEX2842620.1 hypothetical protein [Hyphomicrobium sp.]
MRHFIRLASVAFVLLAALSAALPANAQNKFAQPALVAQTPAQAPLPQLAVPTAEKLVLLIRMSLLTLNDAIQSGNYTVLLDRGGPSFRRANTAAGLSRIFTTLEAQRPDLAAVAILTPQLSEAQIVGPEQRLRLQGYFQTQPMQINFELIYEPADGQWQVFGLSVGAVPAQVHAAPPPVVVPKADAKPPANRQPK